MEKNSIFVKLMRGKRNRVIPTGCFSVYVGRERRRFVIRTESVNHPLFRRLLEDAELEYGFDCKGPLQLPCEVDFFCKVMAELDEGEYPRNCGTCSPFGSPVVIGAAADGYRILPPQRFAS